MDRARLEAALQAADAAGDVEAAKQLAQALRAMDTPTAPPEPKPLPGPRKPPQVSPENFPKVSREEQFARDQQAIPLLQDELNATQDPAVQAALQRDIQRRQNGLPMNWNALKDQTPGLSLDPAQIISRMAAQRAGAPEMSQADPTKFVPIPTGEKEGMLPRAAKGFTRAAIGSTIGFPGNATDMVRSLFGMDQDNKNRIFKNSDDWINDIYQTTGMNLRSPPPENKAQAVADAVVEGTGSAIPFVKGAKLLNSGLNVAGSALAGLGGEIASSFGEGMRGPANFLIQLLTQGHNLKMKNQDKVLKPVLKGIDEADIRMAGKEANTAAAAAGVPTSIVQGFKNPNQLVGIWDELTQSLVGHPAQKMLADQSKVAMTLGQKMVDELPIPDFKAPKKPRMVKREVESDLIGPDGKPLMKTVKVRPEVEKGPSPEEFAGVLKEGPAAVRAAAKELYKTDTSGGAFMSIVRDAWRSRLDKRMNQGGKSEDWAVDIAGRPGTTERETFRAIMEEAAKVRGETDPAKIAKAVKLAEDTADALLVMARGRNSVGMIDRPEFSRRAGENLGSTFFSLPGSITGIGPSSRGLAAMLERGYQRHTYAKALETLMSPNAVDKLLEISRYSSSRNAVNEFGRYLAQDLGQINANEQRRKNLETAE